MMGIFADYAPAYADYGLPVFPCGANDGKRPLMSGWNTRSGKPGYIKAAIEKFPNANIGILGGNPGSITRVDIDDPDLADECVRRFGDTPVKIATPSGGMHLWYRANGESSTDLRHSEGIPVEIKGRNSNALAPPSEHPVNGAYRFLEGGINDLTRLPIAKGIERQKVTKSASEMVDGDGRNPELARRARQLAAKCDNESEHFELVLTANRHFAEPLPLPEVKTVARSAWRYKMENRLMLPGCEPTAPLRANELEALAYDPYAITLLAKLRVSHGGQHGGVFHLNNGTAGSLGIDPRTLRKARDKLESVGLLKIEQRPQRGKRGWCKARLTK